MGLPPYLMGVGLSILIYLNFFTHHFIPDFRYILMVLVFIVFRKTVIEYYPLDKKRTIPCWSLSVLSSWPI